MKRKPLLIGLSISLIALITGCSYGGSAVLSHDKFVTFYEDEELDLQAERAFVLGDIITINYSFIDDDENVTSESFGLSTGSINRWISEKKGSSLSFAYSKDKKDSDKVQLESEKYSSSLSFNSTKITDDEDQEKLTTTETYIYKFDINDVHGSETSYDECNKISEIDSYTVAYLSEDLGQTVKTTTKTWSSTINVLSLSEEFDEPSDVTTTTKNEEIYSFTYSEVKTGLITKSSLTYSFNSVITEREEVIGDLGVISGDKTIKTSHEGTTIDEITETDEGIKQYRESVYHWNGSEYVKDEANSFVDPDDTTFRFELQQDYLDSFLGDALFNKWNALPELTIFLVDLTDFYNALFIGFETYLYGDVENEEIVKEGLTYQYRSLLSSDVNTFEIMQYTFVKPSNNDQFAYLTDVSFLLFDSASDNSVLLSRVSIVY